MPSYSATRSIGSIAAVAAFALGAMTAAADADTKPATQPVRISVEAGGKPISTDLIGIFFEDINDAADGGLYAELVQNRSFEYSTADNADYKPLTTWQLLPGGTTARLETARDEPVHPNNPTYAVLSVDTAAANDPARVVNDGFGGIAVKAGEAYDFSLFGRKLGGDLTLSAVRLESPGGDTLAEAELPAPGDAWGRSKVRLTATKGVADARLVLVARGTGRVAFDVVSLFPAKTFKDRPNGMRADLAQAIADLKPKFMRFPGGCVAHGNSLENMYHWKDTVGPPEQRKAKPNLWGYQQGYGLGYYEYFQFCEDIGAAPLPVVSAGVSCQFAPGGQKAIPMSEMPAYVQEVLDLIDWANGPATGEWGGRRAAAGHPEPFGLKYVAVGNEDAITPEFTERLKLIKDAVRAKYPDIVLIGTSGPFHSGPDFDKGWDAARELGLNMVDEHYYVPPAWLLNNAERYDKYPRKTQVYLGEYAAHDIDRRRTMKAAVAEAAFLTGLERNADVVRFASYAPLLGKIGRTRWDPNLIYFTNDTVVPTPSYHVQKLFGNNGGDHYLPTHVTGIARRNVRGTQLSVGTWHTQAEFDDVRVARGNKTLVQADFAGPANGDPPADWRPRDGRWQVTPDGTYRQAGDQQPAISRLVPTPGDGNYVVSLRARKTGGDEGFLIGFGGVDDENGYWWNLGGWGNTQHAVEKISNGGKEPAAPPVPGRIETGRWYDLRVEVTGAQVKCFLDNKLVHQFRDSGFAPSAMVFASAVRDSKSGDVVLKLVNAGAEVRPLQIDLAKLPAVEPAAACTVLAGDPRAGHDPATNTTVEPVTSTLTAGNAFSYDAPASSFTVVRLRLAKPARAN